MERKKSKRPWIALVLISGVLLFGGVVTYRIFFEDFYQNVIPPKNLSYLPEDSISLSDEDEAFLKEIFRHPFHYLGEGGQSYVFSDRDQRTVLKLFKFHRFRPSWFVRHLPDCTYRSNHVSRKEKKLIAVFTGHRLAYEKHRKDSGLLFAQFKPTSVPILATLEDKNGQAHDVDLKVVPFILQERGIVFSEVLFLLLDRGDVDLAKTRINQVLDLYVSEYQKGIYDTDHGVMHNIGFVGKRPIHLDIGKMVVDGNIKYPAQYRKDLTRVAQKIEYWVEKKFPQHHRVIKRSIEDKLSGLLSQK